MDPTSVLAFAGIALVVVLVPGPSVLFAVARAVAAGRRVALLTVLGNSAGLAVQAMVVAVCVSLVVTPSAQVLTVLRLVGALYLLWLGLSAIRSRHTAALAGSVAGHNLETTVRPLQDGLVVGLTNPKSAVFLAALLPSYVRTEAGPAAVQVLALGLLFCAIALVGDSAWAIAAARARTWLATDPRRLAWSSVAGGLVMVGLGLLVAFG